MADDNKHITDSEKLLLYYKDKLSSEEKHRLEMEMLDDPFMADAAEGISLVNNSAKLDSYINNIQTKFSPTPSPKSTFMQVVANTAAVAASVTILIGAAYYISTYVSKEESVVAEEKAKATEKAPVTDGGHSIAPALEEAQNNDTVIAGVPQVYRWEPAFSYNDATVQDLDADVPLYKSVTDSIALSSSQTKLKAEEAPSLGNNYIYDTYGPASNNATYSWNPNNQGFVNDNTKIVSKDKDRKATKTSTPTRAYDNAAPQQPQADYINGVLVKPDNNEDFYTPPPPTAKELEDKRTKALAKALSSYNNGKYKDALGECETVLTTDPANVKAIYYAGMSCKQLGRKEKAIEFYNKIPAGNTYYESALWEKAQLYKTLKKKDLAVSALQDIIKLNGTYKAKAQTLLNELQGN